MSKNKGIGGHTPQYRGRSEGWLTHPYIIEDLGPFDLDPCSAIDQPWRTAAKQYIESDNGLMLPWNGFVWLNPPYGPDTKSWLNRIALHNNGIALIFARTETRMFFSYVWGTASSILFIEGRLIFHLPDGSKPATNSGGPSVLIGYGEEADRRLKRSSIKGFFIGGLNE